jgi:glycerol-3-phosphate acyltransferase PlsY
MITFIFLMVMAFLIGSIPFGIIIAKFKGVDLKKVGSGNIGATNVLRSLGKTPAIFTLLGDILKGTIAVALARFFNVSVFQEGLIGLASVVGHNFSIFLGFKGGKGVATSFGVLFIYSPMVGLLTAIIWLLVVIISRYSSLGALLSFALLPFNMIIFDVKEKIPIAILLTLFVFIRHISNINRLIKGEERKIGQRE